MSAWLSSEIAAATVVRELAGKIAAKAPVAL
jgi:hypothetical protein